MNGGAILTVGAGPAWEKSLFFAQLRPGEVNRAVECDEYPAGKGANFCRAVRCLGGGRAVRLFQFTGGSVGERLKRALAEEGIDAVSIEVPAQTRCCVTCLDRGRGEMTELIEPSGNIPPEAGAALLRELEAALPGAAGIAVLGTRPPGLGPEFCAGIARIAEKAGIPLLIDTFTGIAPLLAADCDKVLKINVEELRSLTGIETVPEAMRDLAGHYGRLTVAVTAGGGEAHLLSRGTLTGFTPPPVGTVTNPLGCGDTASATLFTGLLDGIPPEEAFARALAAAAANCLTPRAGSFRSREFAALLPLVRRTQTVTVSMPNASATLRTAPAWCPTPSAK